MSVVASRLIAGSAVRITRPATVRQADGSRSREGNSGGETQLFASVKVRFMALTVERRSHVFGTTSQASDTVRVPIIWGLAEGDQIRVLDGPLVNQRFRVEKVIAYRGRPRIAHAECALVAIPAGAR